MLLVQGDTPYCSVPCNQTDERSSSGWRFLIKTPAGKRLALILEPLLSAVQGHHLKGSTTDGRKDVNTQKGPTPEHIVVQQGAVLDANKSQQYSTREKKRDQQSPLIVPWTTSVDVRGVSRDVEPTDDEMRQVQNRTSDVARTGPEMGDGSPSHDASATESNAIPE